METSDRKVGLIFLIFAGLCLLALPFVIFSAMADDPKISEVGIIQNPDMGFDQGSGVIFENYDRIAKAYLEGTATTRTLAEFYARRQYSGSPPFVPHKIEEEDGTQINCLACHERGGWTEALKRNTPVTPHPENGYCRQCHVNAETKDLFVPHDWASVAPPRLGRAHLPGSPPPIPHDLQMRGNCIACHVGPGAVVTIRVEHPSRGNCRQCHVPHTVAGLFQRESNGK